MKAWNSRLIYTILILVPMLLTACKSSKPVSSSAIVQDMTVVNEPRQENNLPVTVDDVVSLDENASVHIVDLLSNDKDIDGDAISIDSWSDTSNGSLEKIEEGFVYTPDPGFSGSDSFSYTVVDTRGGISTASVSILVKNIDDVPKAVADTSTIVQGDALLLDVLANDRDLHDGPITLAVTGVPSNGQVVVNPNGTLTYLPDAGFFGADSLVYQVTDADGDSAFANVNITVQCIIGCNKTMQLSWAASSSSDVTGYRLHIGNAPGVYEQTIDVGNVTDYSHDVDTKGDWFFSVTAVNSAAMESDYSNEVQAGF